jgi:hypothetical protein
LCNVVHKNVNVYATSVCIVEALEDLPSTIPFGEAKDHTLKIHLVKQGEHPLQLLSSVSAMCSYDYRYHDFSLVPFDTKVDYYLSLGRPPFQSTDMLQKTILVTLPNESYADIAPKVKGIISTPIMWFKPVMAVKVHRLHRIMTSAEWIIDTGIESLDMIHPSNEEDALTTYKYTWIQAKPDNDGLESVWLSLLHEQVCFYEGPVDVNAILGVEAIVSVNRDTIKEIAQRALQEDWHAQRIEIIRQAKEKLLTRNLLEQV